MSGAADSDAYTVSIAPPATDEVATGAALIPLIQTCEALQAFVEQHALTLNHADVAAAIVHLIRLSGADGPDGEPMDDEAADVMRLLYSLLHTPAAPGMPTRLRSLGPPELATLLHALNNVRPEDQFRFQLFEELLRELLRGAAAPCEQAAAMAAAASARTTLAPGEPSGWELLCASSPRELADMAQAVARVEERGRSPDGLDDNVCMLNVRAAFAAIVAAALVQLRPCAADPVGCKWEIESLADFVGALARLDHYSLPLMNAVATAAMAPGRMEAAAPASVALLLSSFARLRHDAPALFRHAAMQLRSQLHELRMQELAMAINAYESRHVSSTRWRNEPTSDERCRDTIGSVTASAMLKPPTAACLAAPSAHLDGAVDNGGYGRVASSYMVSTSGSALGSFGTNRHLGSGYASGQLRPMLRMDSRSEPWDMRAGGARKLYLEHLLAVSAVTG